MGYNIEDLELAVKIRDENKGYSLFVNSDNNAFFANDSWFIFECSGVDVLITGRDIKDYKKVKPLNRELQYLELGPGLGEFTPYASDSCSKKPIAIDVANYDIVIEMLEFSLTMDFSTKTHDRTRELLRRCHIIKDKDRVDFYNMHMSEALEKYPYLEGIADVIVENYGPRTYPLTERLEIRKSMLKTINRFKKK